MLLIGYFNIVIYRVVGENLTWPLEELQFFVFLLWLNFSAPKKKIKTHYLIIFRHQKLLSGESLQGMPL